MAEDRAAALDWDALQMLLAVEDAGSLRGAVDRLQLSQPTLGRRIRALEDRLGTALLVRHARGVSFTEDGRAVLEVARETAERIGVLRRALHGRRTELTGRVRVSCTEPVAMEVLPPVLAALAEEHPGLAIDAVVDARASDLDRREADIAIRMFQPRQPALVARRLGRSGTAFYASRDYISRNGAPDSMDQLLEHPVVGPDRDRLFVDAARALGFPLERCRYRTDSFATTLAWTRAGLALGALVTTIADADPNLVRVLPPIQRYPVWLVTHPDLLGSAGIRAVWDRLGLDLAPVFGEGEPG